MMAEGIATLLAGESEFELLGQANTGGEAIEKVLETRPDVVLLDINLPDESGIHLCEYLKKISPPPKILAISNLDGGTFITEMMSRGADGYVLKNVGKDELMKAITTVCQGKLYLSADANEKLKAEKQRREQMPILTLREKEVLQLIAQGLTNTQIAEKLFVSVSTIDSHRKHLLAKLHVNNTASLLKTASENFLLPSEK